MTNVPRNGLVILPEGPVMSSREIAELTGSTHDNVLKTIRRLIAEGVVFGNETPYKHPQNGQTYTEFRLNFRNTMVVISGYSSDLRAKIIDRWQELEAQTTKPTHHIPQTLPEALRLAADLAEQKQVLEAQIEADRPKVEFAMAIRNLDGSCLVREFAKVIGTGEKRLYAWLRDKGYLMANNRPYQEYLDRGLFVVVEGRPFTDSQGKSHPSFTTRITGKGQVALEKRWRDQNRPTLHLVTTHNQEAAR